MNIFSSRSRHFGCFWFFFWDVCLNGPFSMWQTNQFNRTAEYFWIINNWYAFAFLCNIKKKTIESITNCVWTCSVRQTDSYIFYSFLNVLLDHFSTNFATLIEWMRKWFLPFVRPMHPNHFHLIEILPWLNHFLPKWKRPIDEKSQSNIFHTLVSIFFSSIYYITDDSVVLSITRRPRLRFMIFDGCREIEKKKIIIKFKSKVNFCWLISDYPNFTQIFHWRMSVTFLPMCINSGTIAFGMGAFIVWTFVFADVMLGGFVVK